MMRRAALLGVIALLAGGQAGFVGAPVPVSTVLRDIDGVVHGSLENPSGWKWTLLFFLIHDCPIANRYAPEIQRICTSYGPKGARCFLVYADPATKLDEIRSNLKDYKYGGYPAILDARHELVSKAGATISSEVAVFSANGDLKYRGRIDNFYAGLGKPRQVVTQQDLRDTLDALIAGKRVPNPRTQAFGCFIPPKQQK